MKANCIEGLSAQNREKQAFKAFDSDPSIDHLPYFNAQITLQELYYALSSLRNSKKSVEADAVSNEMLNFFMFLHRIFRKCWIDVNSLEAWKQSVAVRIHKQGEPCYNCGSY